MLITFNFDRISDELIVFKIVDNINPKRERFFTWDQTTRITENKQTMLCTGEGNTHSVRYFQETDIIKAIWAN